MTKFFSYLILSLAVVVAACSGESKFTIKGDMKDGKDKSFHLVVHSKTGVQNEILASRAGHFEYTGIVPDDEHPVIVEFFSHDYNFLGALAAYADNEEIKVVLDPASFNGFSADGNDFNKTISEWFKTVKNPSNSDVEKFVRAHPKELVSNVILSNLYDARADVDGAGRLMSLIDPAVRPGYYSNGFFELLENMTGHRGDKLEAISLLTQADTIANLRPTDYKATIVSFTADELDHNDSVVPLLRSLVKETPRNRGLIVEHSLLADTMAWKRAVRQDTCTWTSVWSGAGPSSNGADRIGISRLPYYVVADSTGRTVYTGTSTSKAGAEYRKLIKK